MAARLISKYSTALQQTGPHAYTEALRVMVAALMFRGFRSIVMSGVVGALLLAAANLADARDFSSNAHGLPACKPQLRTCSRKLATCQTSLGACQAEPKGIFPGDGAGSGPALSYTDNGDGTVTDNNTGLMWEQTTGIVGGTNTGQVNDVNNSYTWSGSGTAPDGTVFTSFLAALNNQTTGCFANHCDWRLPNVKELQSIVNYGRVDPAID